MNLPDTTVNVSKAEDDGDDLVVEHRLNVNDNLYYEKRTLRVKLSTARKEDLYFLNIERKIDANEIIFEVSNFEAAPGTARIKIETCLDEEGRRNFYGNWLAHWTPTLPTSPVVPKNVDHVVNVEPFTLCPLEHLSEMIDEHHLEEPSLGGTCGLEEDAPKHIWEFETRRKMPANLDAQAMAQAHRAGAHHGSVAMSQVQRTLESDVTPVGYAQVQRPDILNLNPNVKSISTPVPRMQPYASQYHQSMGMGMGNLNATVRSESSSAVLKKVICQEIIPPMTQGLLKLEKALCSKPEMVGFENEEDFEARIQEEKFGDDIEVSLFARNQSFDQTAGGGSKPSGGMRSQMQNTLDQGPTEFLAKIELFGTYEPAKN